MTKIANHSMPSTSRREFLMNTGRVAAASALAGTVVPHVHAAEDNTIRLALVGCGGRGTGAVSDALQVKQGPLKLVAMADLFAENIKPRHDNLKKAYGDKIDVPEDRRFAGFGAYRKAMDCLRPGDIAVFATPMVFRWVHFGYAIEKSLNVFMEKPLTADGPTSRRMLDLAKQASAKNLKVGVGLMSRHARHLQEVHNRIQDGEIGDIILMRGYRMHGPIVASHLEPWPGTPNELLWQIKKFQAFVWTGGGLFNDFYIHIIDHCCWMKNALPIKVQALGGRHYHQSPDGRPYVDQNFDVYSAEYTFADGSKFIMDGRCMNGAQQIYCSAAHGSKGMAILSKTSDMGAPSSTYRGQNPDRSNMIWQSKTPPDQSSPYHNEWNDLVDAIRDDKPYNEVPHGVHASLVASMGRKAAHTGVEITFDEMLNSEQEYAPNVDRLTVDSPSPLRLGPNGKYPAPMPGIVTDREY